jgi:hypothetical protein
MTATSSRPGVERSLKIVGVRRDREGPLKAIQGHAIVHDVDLG